MTTPHAVPLIELSYRQRRIYEGLLNRLGWQLEGNVPENTRHAVIITEPHQRNWDFPIGFIASRAFGLRSAWLGKQAMFRWPFGSLLRRMGGIAINRKNPQGLAQQVTDRMLAKSICSVAVAPSGTRSNTQYWKSGFYRIALVAQVPILCAYIDTRRKRIGLGLCFTPSGDANRDMNRIRDFYRQQLGDLPVIDTMRLKDEEKLDFDLKVAK